MSKNLSSLLRELFMCFWGSGPAQEESKKLHVSALNKIRPLQSKVKGSCCGHAKWVVFSKSKPCVATCDVLLHAKTTKLFLIGGKASAFPGWLRRTPIDASRQSKERVTRHLRQGLDGVEQRAAGGWGGSLATRVVT